MQLNFEYSLEKDIDCIYAKAKSSNNSQKSTKIYDDIVSQSGGVFTKQSIQKFLIGNTNQTRIFWEKKITNNWDTISSHFVATADNLFDLQLHNNITVYLTHNQRCPYSIKGNYFYLNANAKDTNQIIMHELWHFYMQYKFDENTMNSIQYNAMKEAFTALLNPIFKDMFMEREDVGYPQHASLRNFILKQWNLNQDLQKIWDVGRERIRRGLKF